MIVGDFYINNFLVLGILMAAVGGISYTADVPGMLDSNVTPENPSQSLEISLERKGLNSGNSKTLQVINKNGSQVTGAEIMVNGENVGVTGESGELAFEVPDSENMTVSASKSDVEVTKTFDVEDAQQNEGSGDEGSDGENSKEGDQDSGDGSEENSDDQQGENETSQDNSTEQDNETAGDNETFQPTFIEKVSPENSELQSRSFELVLELRANNSNYRVSLGGEQKLSGQINGNRTITSNLEMPRNGTVGLQAEILKNNEVNASKNYSLTYNAEVDEENRSKVENNVTADFSVADTVRVGEQLTLDASNSKGEIENYSWEFGDGSSEVTKNSETGYSYSGEGGYQIVLTVEGSNGSEDNTTESLTVEADGGGNSTKTPVINFISPVEGLETDKGSIGYEFEVDNVSESSNYSIFIRNKEVEVGGLSSGNDSVTTSVDIPEEVFETNVVISQGGENYSSEIRTVNASTNSRSEPVFSLLSPSDGEVIEVEEFPTSILLQYEITDSNWASDATLSVSDESGQVAESSVPFSSGNHEKNVSGLSSGFYTYNLTLSDGEGQVSRSKGFELQKAQSMNNITVSVNESYGEGWEVNISSYVELKSQRSLSIEADGNEIYSQDYRGVPVEDEVHVDKIFTDNGTHEVQAFLLDMESGKVEESSDLVKFETTEEPPQDGGGDGN